MLVLFCGCSFSCVSEEDIKKQFKNDVEIKFLENSNELWKLYKVASPIFKSRLDSFLSKKAECYVYFLSSKETWKKFRGREGYLAVGNGEIIASLIIRMN